MRECPEEEEIDIVVDQCLDHCILLEQNPKIEIVAPPTNAPIRPTVDNGESDDLNIHLSKRKKQFSTRNPNDVYSSTSPSPTTSTTEQLYSKNRRKLQGTKKTLFLILLQVQR